jgi:uncharacterized membrane protein YphA (DoxX/SURF4 family)
MKIKEIIVEIICYLFILLFVYAAASKMGDYQKFTIQIGQSPLLTGFGDFVPFLVILFEMVTSIFLLFRTTRLIALYGCFCLMVMFTVYIIAILNFTSYIPCSCGGILEKLGWTEHLIFNFFFVALAALGVILQSQKNAEIGSFT